MKKPIVAAQLYTLRDFTANAEDLPKTFAKVKKIGYDYAQISGVRAEVSAADLRKVMVDAGVEPIGAHINLGEWRDNFKKAIDDCHAWGIKYAAIPWMPWAELKDYTPADWKKLFREFDAIAKKALKEAKGLGNAYAIASSADRNYCYIPKGYEIPADLDYFHITTNNTIYGTEIREDIDCPVPLVADMSSDIMSRPVDVSKYALIYGGAQKNVGPAGVAFAIVRKDILGKVSRYIPTMLDYRTHIDKGSMFNTPPVFSIFIMNETLKWIKSMGGVEEIHKLNLRKAETLYAEIDRNSMFIGTADKEDRSIMNVCFVMAPGKEALQDEFLAFAKERGMVGIKGHRSVGGFRASIYNACTQEDVEALVDCMKEFEALKK